MALPLYLAMTAAETAKAERLPTHSAYMACHFSPYSTGLSNFPETLPPDNMLIVNDRTPLQGHDPLIIAEQLMLLCEEFQVCAVLLDFQRQPDEETMAVVNAILDTSRHPVGVAQGYCGNLSCPVFLSAPPPHILLKDHLAPWQGREIWLEAALETELVTVTEKGSAFTPLRHAELSGAVHNDPRLHCRYCTEILEDRVAFTLQRTKEDLFALLEEAQALGVSKAIGLYQQLG